MYLHHRTRHWQMACHLRLAQISFVLAIRLDATNVVKISITLVPKAYVRPIMPKLR